MNHSTTVQTPQKAHELIRGIIREALEGVGLHLVRISTFFVSKPGHEIWQVSVRADIPARLSEIAIQIDAAFSGDIQLISIASYENECIARLEIDMVKALDEGRS